jgi:ricin-type beta-trefoil lectin protein
MPPKKCFGSVPAALLAVTACFTAFAPANATPANGRALIVNDNSNKCLTPAGGSRSLNAQIVQFTCDGHPSRFWSFTIISGNTIEITNLDSGLCLTVAGGSGGRNVAAVQYTCDSHPSRRWTYTELSGGRFRLTNVNSHLCLTVAGGSTAANAVAVQYDCDGHPSRDWDPSPLD